MPLLRTQRLNKTYQTPAGPVPVLRELDFRLESGEYAAIMGPSGSGKSTFMNILGCLDVPSDGQYFFEGREVGRLYPDALAALRRDHIGFVFQGFNLLQRMTLEDNVALPLVYRGMGQQERRRRARQLLERMGLQPQAQSLPTQVSGGQQQRAAIARALINNPKLVLADEPTGNLDSHTSEEIMQIFAGLNREGVTLILVTHEADIAAHARRQVRFHDGVIVHDGPTH
ncbi:MAG: ABC transporter ATP-binding protein [Nevskiales bacterium]